MASSSISSVHKIFKYDVFLSFRGEDTRTNFIDHLYYALQHKGIHTYKDDERIKKGKKISDELIESIEDSKIYIIVFSKNYASSSWCLDELVKIMECHKTTGHMAYPVFYDVEPTEVRNQNGAVGKAFAKHETEEGAERWIEALEDASGLAGWELKNTVDGHEAKFIQKIVEEVSLELRSINFSINEKLIGMETRIKDVLLSLGTGLDDVHMIGIKGIGGGGKTTLARAVFDQISFQFESKSFVENVREVSNASLSGLKSLQNQVLLDVLNDQGVSVTNVYDGKNMMKRMLRGRKVLVVLDDVDHIQQLEALAGEANWFMPGSIIIITTRDEQVLIAHGVKLIHNINLLSGKEAIWLLSTHAFGREIPLHGYEVLSRQLVRYASGLPLTIRILGSFLCGKSVLEWKDALERLKAIPLTETLKKLELSYVDLEDDYKEIFLDVACILKGWLKDKAIEALESCGFHARHGLRVLEQKSLITIDDDECVGMHDHIVEMGRNIVRRSHANKPNKHTRLWLNKEIEDILTNDLGTEATTCIQFYTWKVNPELVVKGLRKMKELRFLHMSLGFIDSSKIKLLTQVNPYFPNALQYVHWYCYPFSSLPKTFQADNLVKLEMDDSRIVRLWEGGERKVLNKLRFLNLSGSTLVTLDLGLTPNLETLTLRECRDLVELLMLDGCLKLISVEVSWSKLRILALGSAPNLELLNLSECRDLVQLHMAYGCPKLRDLNCTNSKLRTLDLRLSPNLNTLDLGECDNLAELHLPDRCLNLRSLTLSNTNLRTLGIGKTHNLEYLDLLNCYHLEEIHMVSDFQKLVSLDISYSKLRTLDLRLTQNLKKLDLNHCRVFEKLPKDLGRSQCLEKLDLSYTQIKHLPDSFCMLKSLNTLNLNHCLLLEKLPDDMGLLGGLKKLNLSETMIEHLPDSSYMLKNLKSLKLISCERLEKLPEDLGQIECLEELDLSYTNITLLPDSICMLKLLKSLKLISCKCLRKLPEDLGRLECLEELDLSSTRIKHLPDSICMLKQMKSLELWYCECLEELPEDLGLLECLKKLTLSSTKIKHLPDSICMLKQMKSLELWYCECLEELPEDLGLLECLEELILENCNLLRDIPNSICNLNSLRVLNIQGTSISHLPQSIHLLKGLCIYWSSDWSSE
ncbi:disease resistance protein RUN1 [Lactuca sativa]|uniref:TIR domain-containing protein n=1 Tax=Lactuca sativa TaxID=4236 RepID=A0A9R1UGA2_LACSA|nr:disease resistance protein RUN1 [Lactuca sativa]KAJ0186495.1 hypothetical protein LSAT_V11C900492180 [Lactuca sativa]